MAKIVRTISHDASVVATAIDATDIVAEIEKIHKTSAVVTAALGRLLTMGLLMGTMSKGENDKLTLQIIGDGPLGSMLVVADSIGNVKGYVSKPLAEAEKKANGKLNVSGIIGNGELRVIKDIGLGEPYVGTVPLQTGEIAEDFAYYFAISEQIPTVVALGVLVDKNGSVKKAGGYILQALPDTPDQILELIEKRIAESSSITDMLESGKTLEEIATYISDDLNTYEVEEREVNWNCDCSRERMERALFSMNKKDIEELAEDEETEVSCHFCNSSYIFSKEEIQNLISNK